MNPYYVDGQDDVWGRSLKRNRMGDDSELLLESMVQGLGRQLGIKYCEAPHIIRVLSVCRQTYELVTVYR